MDACSLRRRRCSECASLSTNFNRAMLRSRDSCATVAAMPSMGHEVLVDLFKNRPSLGAELLTEALGVALPSYTEARLISIELNQIKPAEYRADVVVLL